MFSRRHPRATDPALHASAPSAADTTPSWMVQLTKRHGLSPAEAKSVDQLGHAFNTYTLYGPGHEFTADAFAQFITSLRR
jgi:hypothetical protein